MNQLDNSIFIITVTYNDYSNLRKTFESVRSFKKSYHKYIVIDGGSTDNTSMLLNDFSSIIDFSISEKDSGIYDAMNKALLFEMAPNDLLLWLNSGDLLTDWVNNSVDEYFKYDCVFASVYAKLNDSYNEHVISPKIKLPYTAKNFFPRSTFMHQGFLLKRTVFERLKYDLSVGLQAENLLMSLCIQNYKFGVFDEILSVFYLDGVSNRHFKKLLKSYLAVSARLNFKLSSVLYHQFSFLTKTLIKIVLPNSVFNFIRKK